IVLFDITFFDVSHDELLWIVLSCGDASECRDFVLGGEEHADHVLQRGSILDEHLVLALLGSDVGRSEMAQRTRLCRRERHAGTSALRTSACRRRRSASVQTRWRVTRARVTAT